MSNFPLMAPNPDHAVFLSDVSVKYKIPTQNIRNFKEYIISYIQGKIENKNIWALKNVSLQVRKGEVFGILGRNGAGKSTLLKVISKVLIPTNGRVWIKGQVSPLLQLGAGFHMELTGRENIFLNATLLGHKKKEIHGKFDEIVEFSEIGDYIEAPLRTYSSGMLSRLGFSVATAWQPDILILDEVLSVGDVAFQAKCIDRMESFRENGSTIIIVSHSIERIQSISQRSMWLDHGTIKKIGSTDDVCNTYRDAMKQIRQKGTTINK